jgi:DNA-binding MarR family transcriptional regulator
VQVSSPSSAGASERRIAARFATLLRYLFLNPETEHLRAIEENGLTLTQVKALFLLAADGEAGNPISVNLLAERLKISMPAASRALDCLVRRRLVSRTEDAADRRVRRIAITATGKRLVDKLTALKVSSLESFVCGLTPAQRRKLDAALESLLEDVQITALDRKPLGAAA